MRACAVLALCLVACSKSAPPAPIASETAPSSAPTVASISPSSLPNATAPSRTRTFSSSMAHFEKNRLFECVDLDLTLEAPEDAGPDWKPKKDPLAGLAKELGKKAAPITQPCTKAFSDRLVLATCTYSQESDAGAASATAHFYDFAAVGLNDKQMADCIQNQGKWDALSRDSSEWKRARLEHAATSLQNAGQ